MNVLFQKDDYSEDVFEAPNNDFYDEFQSEEPSTSTERTTPGISKLKHVSTSVNTTFFQHLITFLPLATSNTSSWALEKKCDKPEQTIYGPTMCQQKYLHKVRTNTVVEGDSYDIPQITEIKSSAAAAHYLQVQNTGKCHNPILKVIPVHVEHPNSSVTYTPHCTVLHRCAEDTGCCENDATCQYKKREEVSLYFYVSIAYRSYKQH